MPKMKGVSRDGGTKSTQTRIVLENDTQMQEADLLIVVA